MNTMIVAFNIVMTISKQWNSGVVLGRKAGLYLVTFCEGRRTFTGVGDTPKLAYKNACHARRIGPCVTHVIIGSHLLDGVA